MKKMILTMVAMLSMTTAFAEGENLNSVNNVAAYDMSCNMNKLAEALSLTADQREAVDNIYQTFNAEMMFAAQYYNDDQRKEMVKKALEKNVAWMRYVLNDKQSHTYLMLLNTTINNVKIKLINQERGIPEGMPLFLCQKLAYLRFFCLFCRQNRYY